MSKPNTSFPFKDDFLVNQLAVDALNARVVMLQAALSDRDDTITKLLRTRLMNLGVNPSNAAGSNPNPDFPGEFIKTEIDTNGTEFTEASLRSGTTMEIAQDLPTGNVLQLIADITVRYSKTAGENYRAAVNFGAETWDDSGETPIEALQNLMSVFASILALEMDDLSGDSLGLRQSLDKVMILGPERNEDLISHNNVFVEENDRGIVMLGVSTITDETVL